MDYVPSQTREEILRTFAKEYIQFLSQKKVLITMLLVFILGVTVALAATSGPTEKEQFKQLFSITPYPTISLNPTPVKTFPCPSGTVRVCQAGECECLVK